MFFPSSANNYNVNPFSHLPSSSYHFPPGQALLTHDSNDILFHNHHHDLIPSSSSSSSMMMMAANPHLNLNLNESLVNMALLNRDHGDCFGYGGGCVQGPGGFGFPRGVKKQAVKKDRHSKICTAQGVRDRRVRLSIEIAREFFDLQDMLGFDKASKTVEWLLRKSKNAIREVVKMQPYGRDRYETVDDQGTARKELEGGVVSKEKRMRKSHKESVPRQAKESRAKARARARERTREKMCSNNSSTTKLCSDSTPHSLTQLETFKKSNHLGYANNNNNNHSMASSAFKVVEQQQQPSTAASSSRENVVEESILIRRMLMKPSTILGYQQNYHTSSKDAANNGFPNLSQNWDMNGAMPHPTTTLSAITNANLSTGVVQLYGKP